MIDEKKIELIIAQSAPFTLLGLWKDADLTRLKEQLKTLMETSIKEAQKEAVKGYIDRHNEHQKYLPEELRHFLGEGDYLQSLEDKKESSNLDRRQG